MNKDVIIKFSEKEFLEISFILWIWDASASAMLSAVKCLNSCVNRWTMDKNKLEKFQSLLNKLMSDEDDYTEYLE